MAMTRLNVAAAVAISIGLSDGSVGDAAALDPGSKADLTPESFAKIHALVRPQDHEWRHLRVQWITDVVAARRKAADEDKPMVVLYTGGAGYNEPLGVC